MRYLYYCNSAYQLVNILNLNWHRKNNGFENIDNYKSDLFILNAFCGAKEIVSIINKGKDFDNVILIERVKNKGLFRSLSSFLDIVFPKRYLKKSGNFSNTKLRNIYDYICVPKVSRLTLSVWLLNKKAKIQLFEEGVGTYYGGQHMCYENNNHQELYQLLNGGKKFADYLNIYVNNCALYLGNDKDKVVEIPKYNKVYLKQLKSQFNDILFHDSGKNIYWIGQYMIGCNSKDDINDTIADVLVNHNKEVIFCPHPRIKLDINEGIEKLEANKAWELSLLNIENIESKCFISIYSTAIFSAKLLYDYEPYIVLTINMLKNNSEHIKTMEKIIELFKKTYRDPNKIMIPNSEEELKKYVELYLKNAG